VSRLKKKEKNSRNAVETAEKVLDLEMEDCLDFFGQRLDSYDNFNVIKSWNSKLLRLFTASNCLDFSGSILNYYGLTFYCRYVIIEVRRKPVGRERV